MLCVPIKSPYRDDSNEYTKYTISNIKKENLPKVSKICRIGICSKGLKKWFETAMVNGPSVFELLKFYCNRKDPRRILIFEILGRKTPSYD